MADTATGPPPGGAAATAEAAPAGGESKRKSRWGDKAEDAGADEGAKKKSRWGAKADASALVPAGMGMPGMMPGMMGMQVQVNPEQIKIQARLNEIQRILASPELETIEFTQRFNPTTGEWIEVAGGRSPSPPPTYDRMGKRMNTRDVRLRDSLQKERIALVEKLMKLQPNHAQNPALAGLMPKPQTKITNKIWVPVKEYPGYPFIGLILGPRGNTQKKLERETGARIVIRGKGSVKDGRKGYRGAPDPSEDEDLHVLITAETQEQVDAASKVWLSLLLPTFVSVLLCGCVCLPPGRTHARAHTRAHARTHARTHARACAHTHTLTHSQTHTRAPGDHRASAAKGGLGERMEADAVARARHDQWHAT